MRVFHFFPNSLTRRTRRHVAQIFAEGKGFIVVFDLRRLFCFSSPWRRAFCILIHIGQGISGGMDVAQRVAPGGQTGKKAPSRQTHFWQRPACAFFPNARIAAFGIELGP